MMIGGNSISTLPPKTHLDLKGGGTRMGRKPVWARSRWKYGQSTVVFLGLAGFGAWNSTLLPLCTSAVEPRSAKNATTAPAPTASAAIARNSRRRGQEVGLRNPGTREA